MRPVRITERDDGLGVNRRRIVAYRAECSCEWRGPSRRSYADARADLGTHPSESGEAAAL